MKKTFCLIAVALLFVMACNKENTTPEVKSVGLVANIENLETKADMDANNDLVWVSEDNIGVFVNGWADNSNQQFDIVNGVGTHSGSFVRNEDSGWFETDQANAAFFPWQGKGSTYNNVYGSTMYFKMQSSYVNYTSGKMLTPLVAPLVYTGPGYTYAPIDFKHAAAAVRVTINNLPAGAHSIAMTADQQIYGEYHILVADAGNEAMVLDGEADPSKNQVWLNYAPAAEARVFTFIFPTPTLTTPKLSFIIYDENDILVWSKNLKAQSESIGRAQLLDMPAINITPYSQFDQKSDEWTVIGTANGSNWDQDFEMVTDGTICIAKGLTFSNNGEFKVRKNKDWGESYPSGGNWVITTGDGTYDVIFNKDTHSVSAVKSKCPYPTPSSIQ